MEADNALQVLVHVEGGQRLVCMLRDEEHGLFFFQECLNLYMYACMYVVEYRVCTCVCYVEYGSKYSIQTYSMYVVCMYVCMYVSLKKS